MALTQNPPEGIIPQLIWCIEWITQLRGRLGSGGGGSISLPDTQVVYGTSSGVTSSPYFRYDDTVDAGKVFIQLPSTGVGISIKESSSSTWTLAIADSVGSYLNIDQSTKHYQIGNIDSGIGNGTYISIDDVKGQVESYSSRYMLSTFGYHANGFGGIFAAIGDINSDINATYLVVDDANKVSINSNAVATPTMQIETGGGDVTINDGVRGLYYDPPTLVAAATVTLPANPVDGQEVLIIFGGTITSGNVITLLTILANSGQTLVSTSGNAIANAGYINTAKYRTDITAWYI